VKLRLVPRILDRYIAWRFLALYAANLLSFVILYVLVDSISQYSKLSEKAPSFGAFLALWAKFYAAQVPIIFCRILGPVTAAASGTFVVTLFHRANEFTPVLSSGISLRRQTAPVLLLTWISVIGSAAVQELWIPGNREWIREAKALGRGRSEIDNVTHFDPKRRSLVLFRRYNIKTLNGREVVVQPLVGHVGRSLVIRAREGAWVEEPGGQSHWVLRDGIIQEYDAQRNLVPPPPENGVQRLFTQFDAKSLEELTGIDMLPGDLDDTESQEPYLWMSEILKKVQRSPDSVRWQVRLLSRFVDPLHAFILVLLGIPTILNRDTRNIFLSAIATMLVSALYFVSYIVLLNLGNRGFLSPGMAAGLAPLFFGALGATLYWKMPS
jgi:lipopolysaccharide export LptBFGC system permease protein LptF